MFSSATFIIAHDYNIASVTISLIYMVRAMEKNQTRTINNEIVKKQKKKNYAIRLRDIDVLIDRSASSTDV